MYLDGDDLEMLMYQAGIELTDDQLSDVCDVILWVGDLDEDGGEKTHGLHVGCAECMEEGSVSLVEFNNPLAAGRAPLTGVPDNWLVAPVIPNKSMWDGLARHLMMWLDLNERPTGRKLYEHLKNNGVRNAPDWLRKEIPDTDHVPSKGDRVVAIYCAMLFDAPVLPIALNEAMLSTNIREAVASE